MINNMKTGYSEADKRRIKIWRLMYRITETGHTVSITKEKFLNTYPPLFNPARLQQCRRAGFFIEGGDLCAERAGYRFTAGISA